jgi:DNA-binding transcriptional ArsR family regulator
MEKSRVVTVEEPEQLQALAHPLRLRILEALREEGSAATVARALGANRQNINYHLKELERVELVTKVGERRARNFVETLYRAVGNAFVVSPRAAWGDDQIRAVRDQISLEQLVQLGERLSHDAAALLDRAAFDGEQIPSASVDVTVHLADEHTREQFLDEYLTAVGPILRKYGRADGTEYRVAFAAYPAPETDAMNRTVLKELS